MMTDLELLARLSDLSKIQAETESDIILHLIEVERRNLHLKKAYRSLFEFIRVHLKCSEATASRRVAVVKATAKFPIILDMIREQKLTLTGLSMMAPHLTEENHRELLAKVEGTSKRDIERLVARLSPTPGKRDVIRPVMVSVPENFLTGEGKDEKKSTVVLDGESLVLTATPREHKTEEKVRISFDAPAELVQKIERLKELHAHKLKDGSLAEVIDMAVEMFLDKTAPERKAETKKKAPKSSQPNDKKKSSPKLKASKGIKIESRRPSTALQRHVWRRDEGRCTFKDETGKRCTATSRLQVDHIHPWALGGSSKHPDNLRLLCQAHNLFMATQHFPAKPFPPLGRNARFAR